MKLFYRALFLCSTQIIAMEIESASSNTQTHNPQIFEVFNKYESNLSLHSFQNKDKDTDDSPDSVEELLSLCFARVDQCNLLETDEPTLLEDCSSAQIYLMCLDQFECRILQEEIEKNPELIDKIFYKLIDYIVELMSDMFGNYLCQKLLELCNETQRVIILHAVSNSLFNMSTNIHATRAVQKLIEITENDFELDIIRDHLKDHIVEMAQDLNGNHVVQKCLQKMVPNQNNQFVYDAVAKGCVEVATNRYGCCVLQRCIDYGTPLQKQQIIESVKENAAVLINDPFANYVVQYIIDLKHKNTSTELVKKLQGQIYNLAKQKFSSNVIEKCLKNGDSVCVKQVIRELLFDTKDIFLCKKAQEQLLDLSQDQYGNYVVRCCLHEGLRKADREYMLMVELLQPFSYNLRNTLYGKKVGSFVSTHGSMNCVKRPKLTYSANIIRKCRSRCNDTVKPLIKGV